MAKNLYYVCSQCGHESLRWAGQCPSCHAWNTLKEFAVEQNSGGGKSQNQKSEPVKVYRQSEIKSNILERIKFTMPAVSEVLGGGIARGSLLLFGGNPGVGKSTLLLTIAHHLRCKILYVSAEESLEQVKDRSVRIKPSGEHVLFLSETNISTIIATLEKEKPDVIVVDSIQTVFDPAYSSSAGSLIQVREIALRLQKLAKNTGVSFIIVGHVTKEGNIAGPKILEHIVDGVFYMERESDDFRLLRSGERMVEVNPEGKESLTRFRVQQRFGSFATLVEASPVTGRTHQIRVHALYAGHPIAGDSKYGDDDFSKEIRQLDGKRLTQDHPDIAARYTVTRPGARRFVIVDAAA